MQVIDEKRRRFMELVRQQKTVCQLLVSVSMSCCAWFVSVSTVLMLLLAHLALFIYVAVYCKNATIIHT